MCGSQQGLLINPRSWRKIFKPYLRKLINLIHSFDAKAMYHSCGGTTELWDDFKELQLDIYQTVQGQAKGMDPVQLKSKHGDKITLHGAINAQGFLQTAKPEEVRQTVKASIEVLGANGGFICASSHNLQPDTPVENIVAMYETICNMDSVG